MCRMQMMIVAAVAVLLPLTAAGEEKPAVAPNDPDEVLAKSFSMAKAGEFLDGASGAWTNGRKCIACHTNLPYLMARPLLHDVPGKELPVIRKFYEDRVRNWESGKKADEPDYDEEVVVAAAGLAVNDSLTTKKLHETSRKALDRMWKIQQADGAWNWNKCDWPPLEHDDYYGAVLAAIAVGYAPDDYAKADSAKDGLKKLRIYFQKKPAPNLHHKAWLAWASVRLDGLMSKDEQAKTVKEIKAAQQADGGWSLPSLADWKGYDGRANDAKAPSDGYATGLAIFIMREVGTAKDDANIQKGVVWLKKNQRESGRWFTKSLNIDRSKDLKTETLEIQKSKPALNRDHLITNAGSAFAVMALKACEGR